MLRLVPLFVLAAIGACNPYDPDLGGRPFKCGSSDPVCPEGYACVTAGTSSVCEKAGAADARLNGDASHVMCGTDTSLEPNDDVPHALQTPVRNTQADYMLAKLAICPSTDIDVYGFNTTAVGQRFTITLTYDPSQGQLNMKLLSKQGQPTAYVGVPSGNTIVMTDNRLSVDQWYVQVSAGTGVQNNYSLDISVTP